MVQAFISEENNTAESLDELKERAVALFNEVTEVQSPYPVKFEGKVSLSSEVRRFETFLIENALEQSGGNQVRAAELLNLNYSTLNAKIKRYGIDQEPSPARRSAVSELTSGEEDVERSLSENKVLDGEDAGSLREKLRHLKRIAIQLIEEIEALRFAKTLTQFDEISLPDEMHRFEIHLIRSALDRTGGNQTRAAKILGIKVTTLNNKIKRHRIPLTAGLGIESASDIPLLVANPG